MIKSAVNSLQKGKQTFISFSSLRFMFFVFLWSHLLAQTQFCILFSNDDNSASAIYVWAFSAEEKQYSNNEHTFNTIIRIIVDWWFCIQLLKHVLFIKNTGFALKSPGLCVNFQLWLVHHQKKKKTHALLTAQCLTRLQL